MGRTMRNNVFWGLCILAFLFIMAPAFSVLISIFHQAWPVLSWKLLTTKTAAGSGGLENAILGTLALMLGVFIIGGVIGVAAGIYLAEFSSPRLGGILRFLSEILAGIPSIVIGYVGYVALVIGFHWHYSLLAGWLALSVLVLPYIVKTTEVAIRQVPTALREASAGLGLTRGKTVWRILLPPAVPGIISGLIVAMAISTGETAPLLFTVNLSNFNPSLLHVTGHPIGYLTGVTYFDILLPDSGATKNAHAIAAAAGAVTLVILVILIFIGRMIAARSRKATARMSL